MLHDKNMLAPATASSWCPTMDLLALATADGQLSVARLEWSKTGGEREHKLWTSNPDAPVTSLGWRADGKVLVSGHADGSVHLHDVEDGEVLHVSRPHAAAVTSLHWQEAPAADAWRSACAHQSVAARFAMPVEAASSKGGGKKDASSRGALFDHFDPPARLTVLCSGDADGAVVLSAFGIFPFGGTNLAEAHGLGAGVRVQHASLSPDLSRVLVAFSRGEGPGASAHVATAAVPLLSERSREVCQIAAHASQVARLVQVVDAELAAAAKTWSKAWAEFEARVGTLHARLIEGWEMSEDADGSPPPTVEDHFLALLATGAVEDAMAQFLTHEFQPAATRRLAKSMDAAAAAVHSALLHRVVPALESAVLHLTELQALARWRERCQPVGLHETATDAALGAAESAVLAAAVAVRATTPVAARLRAFFVLLLRTQRTLSGESPDGDDQNLLPAANPSLVRAFLEEGIRIDRLGEQLSPPRDAPGSVSEGGQAAASREAFLAAVRGAAAAAGFVEPADGAATLPPLWRAAGALRGACAAALDAPGAAVSRAFAWSPPFPVVAAGVLQTSTGETPAAPRVTHGGWSEDGEVETLCFHAGGGGGGGALERGRHAVGLLTLREGVPETALALAAPPGQEVVDAAAYTEGRVVVLLQPGEGPGHGGGERPASVVMVDPAELPGARRFVGVDACGRSEASPPPGCVPSGGVVGFGLEGGVSEGATEGVRRRWLPGLKATPPLAVGTAKGLAAVLVGTRRIVLLDLEEDECDEEDSD